jgi:hypothetical protein
LWEQIFPRFEIENHIWKKAANDLDSPFSREEDGRRWRKTLTQWPMEGSIAWWPLEGSIGWWAMERRGATPFYFFSLSPQQILLKPLIFSFDLKVLLYHGSRPLFTHSLPFI